MWIYPAITHHRSIYRSINGLQYIFRKLHLHVGKNSDMVILRFYVAGYSSKWIDCKLILFAELCFTNLFKTRKVRKNSKQIMQRVMLHVANNFHSVKSSSSYLDIGDYKRGMAMHINLKNNIIWTNELRKRGAFLVIFYGFGVYQFYLKT